MDINISCAALRVAIRTLLIPLYNGVKDKQTQLWKHCCHIRDEKPFPRTVVHENTFHLSTKNTCWMTKAQSYRKKRPVTTNTTTKLRSNWKAFNFSHVSSKTIVITLLTTLNSEQIILVPLLKSRYLHFTCQQITLVEWQKRNIIEKASSDR